MTLKHLIGTGFAAFNSGDLATAEASFEQALQLAPDLPAGHYGLGMVRFQQADYAAAVAPLQWAAAGGVGLPDSWRYLCHALAMVEQDEELVVELARSKPAALKAGLVFQILNNRMAQANRGAVQRLAALLPEEDGLQMAGAYWAAVDSASEDGRSTALFKKALDHAARFRAAGNDSDLIASHISSGSSMETDDFILAEPDGPLETYGAIEMLCGDGAADPSLGVVFAAADAVYFEIFASDCARSLASLGPGRTFHIHVVNPTGTTAAAMARLRAEQPALAFRFSIERTAARGDAVYYACARFLRLGSILDRYRTSVTVSDIDGLFGPAIERLPAATRDVDLAFFHIDTVFPWLRCHAALIQIGDSPGGRLAATLLDRFLRRKLAEPRNWTLDQAALFCVVRALARHHPEVRIADLAAVLGASMADAIGSQGSFEQKRQLRLAVSA
jgi:hypothetical protein